MSFRETRNFIEKLKSLGYPQKEQPVFMDSFKRPNFPLMKFILTWTIKTYEPTHALPAAIGSEQDRIVFIRAVVTFLASQAQLKVNPKKLYSADGYAVQEMLKIVSFLSRANSAVSGDSAIDHDSIMFSYDSTSHLSILKTCKDTVMNIVKKGAPLYDLIESEVNLREARNDVISKQLDIAAIEDTVKGQIREISDQTKKITDTISNLKQDQSNISSKLEKKRQELDRREKRLKSLQGVRPAFMDEYEQIEAEIQRLYSGYIQKFRNLHYLEHRIKDIEDQEKSRLKDRQQIMAKWIAQMQQEELSILRNDGDVFSSIGSDKLQEALSPNSSQGSGANLSKAPSRSNVPTPMSKTSPSRAEKKPTILMGSMTAGDDDDDDMLVEPSQVSPSSRQNSKFTAVVDGDETSSHIYDF